MGRFLNVFWVIIFSLIVLAGLLWGILSYFRTSSYHSSLDPYRLLPSDAWLILDLKDPGQLQAHVVDQNLFDDIIPPPELVFLSRQLERWDSLMGEGSKEAAVSRVLISWHHTSWGGNELLFNMKLRQNISLKRLQPIIMRFAQAEPGPSYSFLNATIFQIRVEDGSCYYFTVFRGSLLISSAQRMLEHAITQFETDNDITGQEGFSRLRNLAGRRTHNVFLDGSGLCQALGASGYQPPVLFLSCQALPGWMSWDMVFLEQEIRLSGFSERPTQRASLVNVLGKEPSKKNSLLSFIPSSAAAFSLLSFADDTTFFHRWKQQLGPPAAATVMENQYPLPMINELALVQLPRAANASEPEVIFLAAVSGNISPGKLAGESFPLLKPLEKDFWKGLNIYHDDTGSMLSKLTRDVFPAGIQYLCLKDSVIAGSRTAEALQDYLLQTARPIGADDHFNSGFYFLQPASNMMYYLNVAAQGELGFSSPLKGISRLTFQFIPGNHQLLFSNGILSGDAALEQEASFWKLSLDTLLHTSPFKVINHLDGSQEIIVQDKAGNLYLIDSRGKILWKKALSGAVISDILQVDRFRNGRLQYIFNTRNYLHLIDRNGQYVQGYPLRLPSPATAGLALFDYEQEKNYRVMIPGENKVIYNFMVSGHQVRGWGRPVTRQPVTHPVQFLRMNGRDYIAVVDTTGRAYFFDRRGAERLASPGIRLLPSSSLYAVASADAFLAVTHAGQLVRLPAAGGAFNLLTDSLNQPFGFSAYQDEDERTVFLLAGEELVKAFDHNGSELWGITPPMKITPRVKVLESGQGPLFAMITSGQQNLILADNSGRILPPFQVPADNGLIIIRIQDGGLEHLILGNQEKIRSFLLQ